MTAAEVPARGAPVVLGPPGPEPAELPTLRELLATAGASPAPAEQPRPGALRARLAGSAATAVATLDRPTEAKPAILPLRRATGPPPRLRPGWPGA